MQINVLRLVVSGGHPLRRIIFSLGFIIVFGLPVSRSFAQEAPFWDEISAYKHLDSIKPVPPGAILFVGSSSFRFWENLQSYFPDYTVINRGFGGSTLPDVIQYADDIIFPYQPKQIVIYCGDNDFAASDTVTGEMVYNRFVRLYNTIRTRMKAVDILYVSIKPSPSRVLLMPRMEEANRRIAGFLGTQKHASFVDVYHRMLTPEGRPMADLFLEDQLHMNLKGYAIWKDAIQPCLVKQGADSKDRE